MVCLKREKGARWLPFLLRQRKMLFKKGHSLYLAEVPSAIVKTDAKTNNPILFMLPPDIVSPSFPILQL